MQTTPSGPRRRPGGRSTVVRDRILGATIELVAKDGTTHLSYDEVAEIAQVNRSSVYRNWPDQSSLIGEAILRAVDAQASLRDTGDLRTDLIEFLCALSETLQTHTGRALARVLYGDAASAGVTRTVHDVLDARIEMMRERLESAVAHEAFVEVDTYLFTELIGAPVQMYLARGYRPFTKQVAEGIVDIILAGVRHVGSTPTG